MTFAVAVATATPLTAAGQLLTSACDLAIYEERLELENARLAVDLAHIGFKTHTRVFGMAEELWIGKAIERFAYLEIKYDRDGAELELERAELQLIRQQALLDQFDIICDSDDGGNRSDQDRDKALREAQQRYLDADCDQQIKAIEVAEVDLEFEREYRESILRLKAVAVVPETQVIFAEMEVELENKRLEDAQRRAAECKKQLGRE